MGNKQRRNHTKEFKEEAVKLVLEQGYAISEAARNLGVNPNLLGRWKREMEESGNSGSVSMMNIQVELKQLRKENKRLKLEREILKKASTFFAKETD